MNMNSTFIFVYNADSGLWNGYLDILHKVFSPKTYPCHLCDITYGTFSMREEWAEFIAKLPIDVRFLHKDEWEQEFQRKDDLPALFLEEEGQISTLLEKGPMDQMTLGQLKDFLSEAVHAKAV